MSGRNQGFTLIELLVVIVVIALLVGLLMPAVTAAREAARQNTCTNNQRELARAVTEYDVAKRHLPGFYNQIGGTSATGTVFYSYNWVMAIFPYMERNDLWNAFVQTGQCPGNNIRVRSLVCPDDVLNTASSAPFPLSYVVNDAFFLIRSSGTIGTTPVAGKLVNKYFAAVPEVFVSRMKSQQRSVMLGEHVPAFGASSGTITSPSGTVETYYHAGGTGGWAVAGGAAGTSPLTQSWLMASAMTLNWPLSTAIAGTGTAPSGVTVPRDLTADYGTTPIPIAPLVVNSPHAGVAIITFFDGHTDKIAQSTVCYDGSTNPVDLNVTTFCQP
jgi:prepilin-type N-terminal cleavage/methylation domain-containing protein